MTARPVAPVRPEPPGGTAAVRLFAGLGFRRARRGKLVIITLVILALPAVAALAAMMSGNAGLRFYKKLLDVYLRYLIPFVMALHASATVAEEVQGKTITYLFSRPVARWALPLGKYLGNLAVNATLLCASLAAVYVISLLAEGGEIVDQLGHLAVGLCAVLLGAAHFGAVASAFGAMTTSAPFVATLVWVLVVEVSFALIPGWFKTVAMTVHLRNLAGLYEPQVSLAFADPTIPGSISFLVVAAVTIGWLVVGISWVNSAEFRTDK